MTKNPYLRFIFIYSLFLINCSKEENIEPEGTFSNLGACIGDEFGNCDDGITVFDDNPNNDGNGGGTTASLSSRFRYYHRGNRGDNIFTSSSINGRGNWSGSNNTNSRNRLDDQSISAVQFGDRVAVVHQGRTSNTIFYSFSRDGVRFTTDRAIPTGARTTGTVKAVEFNDRLFVYHYGQNSNKIYFSSTSNGTNWVGNTTISDTKAYGAFDLIAFKDRLFLIGRSGIRYYISSSTDGINFSEILITTPGAIGTSAQNISLTEVDGTFYILAELGSRAPKGLAVGRWIPNPNNPSATTGSRFVSFSPIYHNGGILRTDQPASIATDGNTLSVAFENFSGNGISIASTTNFKSTSIFQPISGWNISGGSGRTRHSGISFIHTKE